MVERIQLPQQTNGRLRADVTVPIIKEASQEQVLSRANALGLKIKKRFNEEGEPENHYKIIMPGKRPFSRTKIIYHGSALNSIEALKHAIEKLEFESARKRSKLLPENLSVQRDFSSHRLPIFGPKYTVYAKSTIATWEHVLKGRFRSTEDAKEKALGKIARTNKKRVGQKNG